MKLQACKPLSRFPLLSSFKLIFGRPVNLRFDGILMMVGAILEQILGNHLPAISFGCLSLWCFTLKNSWLAAGLIADDTPQTYDTGGLH